MKTLLVIVSASFILFSAAGCGSKIDDVQFDYGGVVVSGYNSEGYIENISDFPVRVQCVELQGHMGEVTQWLKKIEPGPQHRIKQYIECNLYPQRFYVYDLQGVLIGFIKPTKPKDK